MNKKYTPVTVADVLSDLLAGKTPKKGDYAVRDAETDYWHDETILTRVEFGPGSKHPFVTKYECKWRYCARVTIESIAKGHNPQSLTEEQVGVSEGWRLLTKEECHERAHVRGDGVEFFLTVWHSTFDNIRAYSDWTFRTKHPEGYYLPKPVIAEGFNPRGLTVEQVGEGWRLLTKEEIGSGRQNFKDTCWWRRGGWSEDGPWSANLFSDFALRTRKPAGYFLPKVPRYVPWTFETAPKDRHVLVRFGGGKCWRLILSWAEKAVGFHEYPRDVCYYNELFEKAEASFDGGKTWGPAGTKIDV